MAKRIIEACSALGCTKLGSFARGLCSRHYREFKEACIKNRSWSRGIQIPKPSPPCWEYENPQGEKELAERYGKQVGKGEK